MSRQIFPPAKRPPPAPPKKTIGFVVILLLTTLAVFLTGFVSCLTAVPVVDFVGTRTGGLDNLFQLVVIGLSISFIPPLLVLLVMARWAQSAYRREALEKSSTTNSIQPTEPIK